MERLIKKETLLLFFLMVISFMMIGCSAVGPNYVRPDIRSPDHWHTALKNGLSDDAVSPQTLASWWTVFDDPVLNRLIGRAIAGNLDLKTAQLKLKEARFRRNMSAASLFPLLNVSGSHTYTRDHQTDDGGKSSDEYSAEFRQNFSAGLDAAWEIDIFGGVRRSVEASEAESEAAQENLRDVLVSLLAEVALNYVDMRTYQARIEIVEDNLTVQNETYQLTQWRQQAGLSDERSVQQALYNLESTRSQKPLLITGLEEAMNRIAILLGEAPGRVHEDLSGIGSIPAAPVKTAVGVPADIIRQRPDIRRAERNIAAQTAKIGAAVADLYPKLSLNGTIGIEALSFGSLVNHSASSSHYGISGGPRMSWAVFKGGSIRQNIHVQTALQEQAITIYESTILSALEEVENALTAYSNEQQRMNHLREAVNAAQQASELAQQQYRSGLTDFGNVLEAQRSLLSYQDQLIQSSGAVTSDLIRLYKALGGGWTSGAENELNKKQETP